MRKLILSLIAVATMVFMSGCEYQTIPPGYVGKIIDNNGIHPEIIEPSRVKLDVWGLNKERLIYIDVSTVHRPADVKVIMADRHTTKNGDIQQRIGLDMDFIVNVRYRLRDDEDTINAMLKDMRLSSDVSVIKAEEIYNKYGNMIIGRVAREILGQYTPEEILDSLDEINKSLHASVQKAFQSTPLIAAEVSLGPITLPNVITARIQKNKDTELKEAERLAQQKIDLLDKQNEIELARQQAVREEIDARSLANQNAILAKSITPEVLRLRELAIREKEIEMMRDSLVKGNSTVFIPYGAVDSAGAQFRMYNEK